MENLISMTDFLPEHPYSKFLKQKLELRMFVPCRLVWGVWVVLEEPNFDGLNDMYYSAAMYEYQEAKERCLFDGFEKSTVRGFDLQTGNLLFKISDYPTIEYFLSNKHNVHLKLTASALKQIGL